MNADKLCHFHRCVIAAIGSVKSIPTSEIVGEMDLVYDLNMDSLDLQEMIYLLEGDYHIVIQACDLAGVRTVYGVVECCRQHTIAKESCR